MDKNIYWLWLTAVQNISPGEITALLEYFNTPEEIYRTKDYSAVPGIRPFTKFMLRDKDTKRAELAARRAEECGAKILTFDDIDYPDSLRMTDNPPYVLYVRGEIMKWDRILGIGVVGTRSCSDYGIAATNKLCTGLAEAGVTIISGMARGIDSAAAKCALRSGGKTIAVLGCGIDIAYPPENAGLMEEIAQNGAVITEFPPGTKPLAKNFPWRNRIISGLSRGIIVIEAPKKSGALITADHALEQGKNVYAVPGSIFKENCEGSNKILSNYAKPVSCSEDILEDYIFETEKMRIEKPKKNNKNKAVNNEIKLNIEDKRYSTLSEDEKTIVELLLESNMHIDDLTRKSGMDSAKITPILSLLEFGGFISKIPGNNYKLNV